MKDKYATSLTGALNRPANNIARITPSSGNNLQPTGEKKQTSRKNRVGYTVWLKPEMKKQIKILAVELECTEQALVEDALNKFFEILGKSKIE